MIKSQISKLLLISIFAYPLLVIAEDATNTIKIRARMEISNPKNNSNRFSLPSAYNISKPFSKSGGINIASSYFFNDRIASEFTIGVHGARLNNTIEVANAFNGTDTNFRNKKSFFFPVSLGGQYYPIKTSNFNFYTGLGVHYTFITNNKNAKINNSSGVFAQVGFDLYSSYTLTGVNFDVKKYWQKVNIKYKVPSVTNIPLRNKAKLDPWVFSTGIFYPF